MFWYSKKVMFLFTLAFVGLVTVPQYIHWHISVDGGYTDWTSWSICTHTCGYRVQGRTRNCTNPVPRGGGKLCSAIGPHVMVKQCTFINCPQDGKWGNWGPYGPCNPNCKDGKRYREKLCDNPPPAYGGMFCVGPVQKEENKCDHLAPCPIDGGLSAWENWGACSVTCGDGTRKRKRLCNNPAPQFNGKGCAGPLEESGKCKDKDCPVATTAPPAAKTAAPSVKPAAR